MKKKKWSLRAKIMFLSVGLVFLAIVAFATVSIFELKLLLGMIDVSSQSQNEVIKDASDDKLWEYLIYDVMNSANVAAKRIDGEVWTAGHDLEMLGRQVGDIFRHPERYNEVDFDQLKKEDRTDFEAYLFFAEGAKQDNEESLIMARKLANLVPMMEEIIVGNEFFTSDCYIALPSGITLGVDDYKNDKYNADGSIKTYDPRQSEWYKEAVNTGKPYFTSVVKSDLHNNTGVEIGVPVYVDNELVAVINGLIPLNVIQNEAESESYSLADFKIIVSDEGMLIYSPRTSGELAMDDLSKDLRQSTNKELRSVIEDALTLVSDYWLIQVDGDYFFACYCPISTLDWTLIMFLDENALEDVPAELMDKIDVAREDVFKSYQSKFRHTSFIVVSVMAFLILAAIVLASVFSRRLVTPLDEMTKSVKDMSGDDISFAMQEVYETGDEIEVLANTFSDLTDKLKLYIAENAKITANKERIDAEMALSNKIQGAMLPRKFPAFSDRNEFDLFADMVPAREVGGDFYDFYLLDSDHLILVVGDVSGKGITAALFMVMAKYILQSQIMLYKGNIEEAVLEANSLLMEDNAVRLFVTVWLGVLTISTGHLVYVNAGHTYPIISRAGNDFEMVKDIHGVPLATRKRMKLTLNETDLGHGDTIYIYTDGMTETVNHDMEMFGMDRLVEVLNQNKDKSVKEMDEAARKAVLEFSGEEEQFDDMTSLVFKYI